MDEPNHGQVGASQKNNANFPEEVNSCANSLKLSKLQREVNRELSFFLGR